MTRAEKIRKGLDRAQAEERFDRSQYERERVQAKWAKAAPGDPDGSERWISAAQRLARISEGIDAYEPGRNPVETTEPAPVFHEESILEYDESGQSHVRPLPDSEEIAASELYDFTEADRFRYAKAANDSFFAICERETGRTADAETLQAQFSESELLKSQSHLIAARIERASRREADFHEDDSLFVPMYRETNYGVYSYYLFSKCRVQAPKFRNSCFLPYMASQQRGKMLKALEHYLSCNPFARMWTFTSGKRVGIGGIRKRCQWLHRRLSKLNKWMKTENLGLELVFRSTEFGTPEGEKTEGHFERDESGEVLFHVHAHCLVRLTGNKPFTKERWAATLEKVWKYWGYHWDDGKSVRDARELCKYVSKPGALLGLEDWELLALYRETNSLRLVQPLGQLRDEIRSRKERKMRLEKVTTPDGKVFQEVHDWNCHRDSDDAHAKEWERWNKANERAERMLEGRETSAEDEMRILAKCVPGFAPGSTIKEPRIVVMATNWNQAAIERHPLVQDLIRATWEQWKAGQVAAAAIRVHTGTLTVHEPPDEIGGFSPGWNGTGYEIDPPGTETFDFYRECARV